MVGPRRAPAEQRTIDPCSIPENRSSGTENRYKGSINPCLLGPGGGELEGRLPVRRGSERAGGNGTDQNEFVTMSIVLGSFVTREYSEAHAAAHHTKRNREARVKLGRVRRQHRGDELSLRRRLEGVRIGCVPCSPLDPVTRAGLFSVLSTMYTLLSAPRNT